MSLLELINPWGELRKWKQYHEQKANTLIMKYAEVRDLEDRLSASERVASNLRIRNAKLATENEQLRKELATACPRDTKTGRFRPKGG